MKPRSKRPRPAIPDKAFEKRVAELKVRAARILLLIKRRAGRPSGHGDAGDMSADVAAAGDGSV